LYGASLSFVKDKWCFNIVSEKWVVQSIEHTLLCLCKDVWEEHHYFGNLPMWQNDCNLKRGRLYIVMKHTSYIHFDFNLQYPSYFFATNFVINPQRLAIKYQGKFCNT